MTDVGCPLGCGKLQRHRAFLERGIYVEPEWVAAAVGAIAAVVVAWQSWETRKNAKAAGEAARAANEAVALARIEEGHTRTLIAEAVRTRIDASTPTLTLIVGKPTWPPIRTIGALGQPPEEVPVGTHFVMPRDAGVPIHVRQLVGVLNSTDRPVELHGPGWFDPNSHLPIGNKFQVSAQGELWGYYVWQRTLGEWVESAEQREQGISGPEYRFELIYVDQADTGAIDNYVVVMGGVPIERVPGELGGWRIAELSGEPHSAVDAMDSVVQPRQRRYWLSRTRNEPLP